MGDIHFILKQYWGFDSFRPLQEDIIKSVLSGKDTLALMPTGGGKSLCYQIPGMAKDGLCLVISPLIALMKDQVANLHRKSITAFAIYSGMNRKEVINTLKTATSSNCKFLYVSPERLETSLFKEYLPAININLIAVDEAHCISQWGYDFRPPYLRIAALRDELRNVPVLALTASATTDVQNDICDKLAFGSKNIFRQSFERSNLSYSVFNVDSKINKIIEVITKVPGTGIVYCKSRKRTKEISELLQLQGISSGFYHAGLSTEERTAKQEDWIKNKIRVIVCTNAFGMGIDKPDVRTVIHADVPDCLENYYQEAGRAGRDGKKSYAVLLYDESDLKELNDLPLIRYPSIDTIREIYTQLANYLQIPAGTGEGEYFDFDISDFLKKFKLSGYNSVYSLKALEQDDWLSFNEQVFIPSKVNFTTGKDYLYEFEKSNPSLEPLIKALLRAYDGIFDFPTVISETTLGRLLKKDKEEIKKQLTLLDRAAIIEYSPQKDNPQIFLSKNRVRSEDLMINVQRYAERKEKFILRIRSMIGYTIETIKCRSKITANYFGDMAIKDCGICDNCLRKKEIALTKDEFETISNHVMNILTNKSIDAKDLLRQLSMYKKEKAWKVIDTLQAENKILVDKEGLIYLK
ncbi:MAG: ATP-dependent DNA helicase RecQ [Chitinophagaceae bacterium]